MYIFVSDRGMLLFIGHGHVTSQEVQCSLRGTSVVNKAVLNDVTLQSLTEVQNIFVMMITTIMMISQSLSKIVDVELV